MGWAGVMCSVLGGQSCHLQTAQPQPPPELGLLVHERDTGSGDADEAALDEDRSANGRFAHIIS